MNTSGKFTLATTDFLEKSTSTSDDHLNPHSTLAYLADYQKSYGLSNYSSIHDKMQHGQLHSLTFLDGTGNQHRYLMGIDYPLQGFYL
jgi:hypothetical protein